MNMRQASGRVLGSMFIHRPDVQTSALMIIVLILERCLNIVRPAALDV